MCDHNMLPFRFNIVFLIALYKDPHERVFIASFIFPYEIYIDFCRKSSLFAGLFSVSILIFFFFIGRGSYFYP